MGLSTFDSEHAYDNKTISGLPYVGSLLVAMYTAKGFIGNAVTHLVYFPKFKWKNLWIDSAFFIKLFTELFFVTGSHSVSEASQIPTANDINTVYLQTFLARAI